MAVLTERVLPRCSHCGDTARFMVTDYGRQQYVCAHHLAPVVVALGGCAVHVLEQGGE